MPEKMFSTKSEKRPSYQRNSQNGFRDIAFVYFSLLIKKKVGNNILPTFFIPFSYDIKA